MEDVSLDLGMAGTAGGHIVTVSGDVDMATAPQLAEYLAQFANGDIHVDLAGVGFLDSAGLSALVGAHKAISARGKKLILHGAPPALQQILALTNLDDYLHLDGAVPAPIQATVGITESEDR